MKKNQQSFLLSLGWALIVLSIMVAIGSYFFWTSDYSQLNNIGGWWGGITAPLLNIAGFVIIYAAFRQQSFATEQTQLEFEVQRFENTFFNLVNLLHQNLTNIQQNYRAEAGGGTHFFAAFEDFLDKNLGKQADQKETASVYKEFHQNHSGYIDHFVRHLIFTLEFISETKAFKDNPDLDEPEDRKRYFRILGAQLAMDELLLLDYHTRFDPASYAQDFRKKLEKYGFFDRLN